MLKMRRSNQVLLKGANAPNHRQRLRERRLEACRTLPRGLLLRCGQPIRLRQRVGEPYFQASPGFAQGLSTIRFSPSNDSSATLEPPSNSRGALVDSELHCVAPQRNRALRSLEPTWIRDPVRLSSWGYGSRILDEKARFTLTTLLFRHHLRPKRICPLKRERQSSTYRRTLLWRTR